MDNALKKSLEALNNLRKDPERILDEDGAAAVLGKSRQWLKRARYSRTGPKYGRIGRTIVYRGNEILAFVDGKGDKA